MSKHTLVVCLLFLGVGSLVQATMLKHDSEPKDGRSTELIGCDLDECAKSAEAKGAKYCNCERTGGSTIESDWMVVGSDVAIIQSQERANIVSSPTISKQLIFSAGRLAFGQTIDVVCSRNKFSYTVVSSKIFCEASRGRITCFAFLQP